MLRGAIQFSHHVGGGGGAFFEAIDKMGIEGMVSKRAGAPYRSGRTDSWLKIKSYEVSEYEVAGVTRERGKPAVAILTTSGKYAGAAFIGSNKAMCERLWARVQKEAPPPEGIPKKEIRGGRSG
jgi:bifunctional non-homologous end joining protein LigD